VNPANVNDGAFRSIPSRNLRTGGTPPAVGNPQGSFGQQAPDAAISREEQYRKMEDARVINEAMKHVSGGKITMPPLPPTPFTPSDAP
jgi:hypothetical protein